MTTTAAPPGGHSVPLGLMSCVRESSPQDMVPQTEIDLERNETSKKRRFHPFRGLRKIFRRSGKVTNISSDEITPVADPTSAATGTTLCDDAHRSRSTSELLSTDSESAAASRKKAAASVGSVGLCPGGGGALSVSHDSVFTAEHRSTSSELDTAQSSSSLSIQQLLQHSGVRAELLDVVRRRGRGRGDTSEDEEDLGLPRSPCNSPTTTDKALKEHPTKSHSTCSDGSLLSMGSSEMDEDSLGQHSRHSSKLSLHDRRPSQSADSELEFGPSTTTAPLSHSAARHKMSVRPKRTHGAPRRRRTQQLTTVPALPTTPEVNEEISTRSLTPEGSSNRETIAELYSSNSKVWSGSVSSDTQLKSSSLPLGLALASGVSKLSRSRSNARDAFLEEDEPDDKSSKEDKKKEESFFGRFLARRSGKKKKSKSEDSSYQISYKSTEDNRTYSVDSGMCKIPRSGPAARQRVQPIDIPSSPDAFRLQKRQQQIDLDLPMPPVNNSPTFLPKQAKVSSPEAPIPTPRTILPKAVTEVVPAPRSIPPKVEEKNSEFSSKVKITGLSSYQQKVLSYNDDIDGFETCEDSISTFSFTKSQSFRSKSVLSSSQEPSSLPVTVNSSLYDTNSDSETFADSLMSTTTTTTHSEPQPENEVKIINTNSEETIENGVTISCVNSQMQASVNTSSSNQVVVSISNSSDPEPSQVSISKVQMKRDSLKTAESSVAQVPEFLKIQLNKVDAKPVTNVVLSTSNSFGKADETVEQKPEIETDKDNGEIITESVKRKFSADDVEIVDKDLTEEIVEVPSKNITVTNLKFVTPQLRKSSLVTISSQSNKPYLKKKSNSLELGDSVKIEEVNKEKTASAGDVHDSSAEVVLRKKSLVCQKKDKDSDEPELMKVFARRSLKLKDSEIETLSQQVLISVEDNQAKSENNKRDSDKENEGNESPPEERKKSVNTKEPLTESKFVEEVSLRKPSTTINNKLSVFGGSKYQRTVSLTSNETNENFPEVEKRKNKSYIEPKPVLNAFRSPHILKDLEIKKSDELITLKNEDFVPRFKRIQQRKEEWEQRAQQNMKKSVNN